jgi:NADPH-dependent curcumin reductase CurA
MSEIDPAMRGWLNDTRSYIEPVKLGEVMRASGVATVVAAGPGSKFKAGETVQGAVGWQDYGVFADKLLQPAT